MPLNLTNWTVWGTGTQDQSGGTLNQTATGVSGQYVGVYSNTSYDLTNKAVQMQIAQLPSSATGNQAVLRVEIDANNAVIIGYSDGGLLCQHQIASTITNVLFAAWPAGTIGFRINFDNTQNRVWFDTYAPATGWVNQFYEAIPIATTSLRVSIATGCYQAVASPGSTRWESVGLPIIRNLTGASTGTSTVNEVISARRSLVGSSAGVATETTNVINARRSLIASAAGVTTVQVQFGALSARANGVATASATLSRRIAITASAAGTSIAAAPTINLRRSLVGASFGMALDAYRTRVKSDAPVGWWRFGETAGTTAADSSGNNNPGTWQGGYTLGTAGALPGDTNTAATISITNDGKSIVLDAAVLRTPVGNQWSVECWVFPTVTTNGRLRYVSGGGWGVSSWYSVIDTSWGPNITPLQGGVVSLNVWSHIVAVYDGANIRHYLNGKLAAVAAAPGALAFSASDLTLGGRASPTTGLEGQLDEIALYNYALSAAQVASHFAAAPIAPTVISRYIARFLTVASAGTSSVSGQITRYRSLSGTSAGTTTVSTVFGIPTDVYGLTVYNDPTLLAYWRLGEPSGTNARDTKGSHGGTYVGGCLLNQPGGLQSTDDPSVDFNGSTGYVSIPDFPIVGPAGGFTIEAWFKMDTVVASAALFSKRQDVTPYDGQVELEIGGGGVITFWVNTTTGWHPLTSTRAYAVGVWHHVTAHYQTDSGGMQSLNVNGEGQGVITGVGTVLNTPAGVKCGIGRNFYGGGTYNFDGCIDEVAVYNATAPSIAWVRDHYRKGVASRNAYQAAVERIPGLVAYWPLNEATRPNAFDEAGNGHTLDYGAGALVTGPGQGIAGVPSSRSAFWNQTPTTARMTRPSTDADLNFGAGPFSIEFWTYQDATNASTAGCIMEWGDGTNWGVHLFNWDTTMPQNLWVNLAPTDATAVGINSGDFLTPAVWHHVVVLRTGNTCRAYIDGVKRGPDADATGKTLHFDYPLNIGWRPSPGPNGGYNHIGYLDQIALYNVALTPTQINEHYIKGIGQVYNADLVGTAAGKATANARAPKQLPLLTFTDDWEDGVITPDKWIMWSSGLTAEQSARPWGVRV